MFQLSTGGLLMQSFAVVMTNICLAFALFINPFRFGNKQNAHYRKSLSPLLLFHANYPVCCPLPHNRLPGTVGTWVVVPVVPVVHLVVSFPVLLHDLLLPGLGRPDVSLVSPIVLLGHQSRIVNLLELLEGMFLYCPLEMYRALWYNSNSFYLKISIRIDLIL